jgi:hypothetical protein
MRNFFDWTLSEAGKNPLVAAWLCIMLVSLPLIFGVSVALLFIHLPWLVALIFVAATIYVVRDYFKQTKERRNFWHVD